MYNFGQIKETYNKLYLESFSTKDIKKKDAFKFYVDKLKSSPLLKEEFECYNSIQNTYFDNQLDSQIFIQENINIIKNLNQRELNRIHSDLIKKLKSFNCELVESEDEKIVLFESLLNLEKKSKNLNKISESTIKLRSALVKEGFEKKDEDENVSLPTNVLSNLLANKFNSKYNDLDESTKNIIKVSLNGSEEEKSGLFNSTIKECVELVNIKLKESHSDLELKDKLLQTKERLLDMSFNRETYIEDLTKIVELKISL